MRLAMLVVALLALTACGRFGEVSFTPADAPIVATADCLARDVVAGLTDPGREPRDIVGYPPDGFDPVAVIVCERGVGSTIDTVRLEGDMGPVLAAFRENSVRLPDGSIASCAIAEYPAAGLWLVDADGRLIRPAWPSRVCGFQPAPLAPLAALHEVSRDPQPVELPESRCRQGRPNFIARSEMDELKWQGVEVPEADRLRFPIGDVDALSFCQYVGETHEAAGRTRLDREESRALLAQASSAPAAQPCAVTAGRTASAQLLRPNGSGGGVVGVELDGCQRVILDRGYRVAPPELITALGG